MTDILVPAELEGTKAVVRTWLKAVGDRVAENDPLVELETDKVAMEVPAPGAGILDTILCESDREVSPGDLLGRLRAADGPTTATPTDVPTAEPASAENAAPERHLSPAVRRAVRQHGLDPATIEGTGRGGRITRADVDRVIEAGSTATAAPASPPARAEIDGSQRSHSVPHDRMRRLIAENMLNSVTTAPHVTAVFEADFSAIIAHRRAHKEAFAREGVALTLTAYAIAAAVAAMREAPAINSRWHEDRLEYFDDIDIGVGTALGDRGLVVPVVRRAQELSLRGIAAQLDDLVARARAGKLRPADVKGGTFSISNHGVSGSLVATPIIINQPQSAILGLGKLEKRVVVREVDGVDTIQIRPMCYVSLTIDHRVVDGHQTNRWLSRFVEVIEGWKDDNP